MAGSQPNHYFSSAQRLIQTRLERFWIPIQTNLCCRRWRPAKIRGHSVSSALPCISFHNRAEGTAGTLQRGKLPGLHLNPETCFSKAQLQVATHTSAQKTHSTQQAWMNSRNPLTITSVRKHRQPVILHPTKRTGRAGVNREPSVRFEGSQTFALLEYRRRLTPARLRDLLNLFSASTLQVFQFIWHFVPLKFGRDSSKAESITA